jgi:hypothetical protein
MKFSALIIVGLMALITLPAYAQQSGNSRLKCNADTKVLDTEPKRAAINFGECVWVRAGCNDGSARCVCGRTSSKGRRARGQCQSNPG